MACITKRRDRWVIDFYDQYGKRRWKTLPKGATKGKARDELRNIEESLSNGTFCPTKRMPAFSTVAGEWLEYKKPKLRSTTWKVYEGHVRNHFEELNHLKIVQVTLPVLEKFISDRQTHGMNINTIRKILVTLGQILSYAARHRYIDHNPLRDVERPRDSGEDLQDNEITVLTPEQIQALLGSVDNQKYRTLFMLAVMTGARQGELLGLKWSDLDIENHQIHIQRTFNKGRFFPPKTKKSTRRIDLGPGVVTELRKWKIACSPNGLNLMFPNDAGNPINYSNMVRREFQPALRAAGLPKLRFHDLRHTFASLLIEQGENIKYIQTQLGHSTPTVTLNVYAHLFKSRNQEAAHRLEKTVFRQSGSKMVAKGMEATSGDAVSY
ncbi:MAG: site-specific integrase [Deltaproteobacteria bacterium]|nr:site-specific integrase [Deltaproteobacteria bacterium]